MSCVDVPGHVVYHDPNTFTVVYTPYEIPAPYDRIVNQLIAKSMHSQTNLGHESGHRGTYALEVLDAFGDKLRAFKASDLPPVTF